VSTAVSIPALSFHELDAALAEALRPRVDRLGYLGEFFQRTAHQPEALRAFVAFTEAARAAVPVPLAEVVALTVSTALGNDYERNQHQRLAVREGLSRAWVEQIGRLAPERAELSAAERAAQRYVLDALASHGDTASGALDALVDEIGVAGAVGVMFVMGRYLAHAVIVNSLGLAPPVPSIFEDGFDGS